MSRPFMILAGMMLILFIVGLVLIAVLISRNNNPSDIELTATAITNINIVTEGSPSDVQTLAAATPTAI